MQSLCWIVVGSLAMCAIALVGSVTLFLSEETMQKLLLPLVSIAAGSMLGGAFFHMIPAGIEHTGSTLSLYVWIALGFSTFFALEQFLHWQHCHRAQTPCRKPYLPDSDR